LSISNCRMFLKTMYIGSDVPPGRAKRAMLFRSSALTNKDYCAISRNCWDVKSKSRFCAATSQTRASRPSPFARGARKEKTIASHDPGSRHRSAAGAQDSPTETRLRADAAVVLNDDAMHPAIGRKIIGDSKVLRCAVVPDGDGSVSPAKANLQARRFNMTEQELQ